MKTTQKVQYLREGDKVKNILDGEFYSFIKKEKAGNGYMVTLCGDGKSVDGNLFYCAYNDILEVKLNDKYRI